MKRIFSIVLASALAISAAAATSAGARGPIVDAVQESGNLEESPLEALMPYAKGERDLQIYSEAIEREKIRNEAGMLFYRDARALAKLDAMLAKLRKNDERTQSGTQKLAFAYERFELEGRVYVQHDVIDSALDVANYWVRQQPKSASARIVRAILLKNRALLAITKPWPRGQGKSNEPEVLLKAAIRQIESDRKVASADPHWYTLKLSLAPVSGTKPSEILRIVDESSRTFPTYIGNYLAASDAITAVSKTPAVDLEAVAVLASVRAAGDGEGAHYARVYWSVMTRARPSELNINWPHMKKGIASVLKRYPTQWNINHFAARACEAGDRDTTRDLIARMRGRPVLSAWRQIAFRDNCALWVKQPANVTEKAIHN